MVKEDGIIRESMDRSMIAQGETFWILQVPGTDRTVMSFEDGKPVGPITFESEAMALRFRDRYKVSKKMKPTFHTVQLWKH